ncbi:unnamed protein product [Protopolystoma xenopodis]|uniref:Uncharacterized protein n=1 Tax=Protopolystoma xenopodis TaxID=117903 RepID=A0A448X8U0_9PLAT|nr:unnamed protein product [Protopolystoma xenopodis]
MWRHLLLALTPYYSPNSLSESSFLIQSIAILCFVSTGPCSERMFTSLSPHHSMAYSLYCCPLFLLGKSYIPSGNPTCPLKWPERVYVVLGFFPTAQKPIVNYSKARFGRLRKYHSIVVIHPRLANAMYVESLKLTQVESLRFSFPTDVYFVFYLLTSRSMFCTNLVREAYMLLIVWPV